MYFGKGAHGVFTAAQRYFGKDLETLTLGEAALLAGQVARPATFSPFRHRASAEARRDHVLNRMVAEGFAARDEAEAARREPLPTQLHSRPAQPNDHFAEEVRRRLLLDPRLGKTRAERRKRSMTIHRQIGPVP